jgi:hypothetical protein
MADVEETLRKMFGNKSVDEHNESKAQKFMNENFKVVEKPGGGVRISPANKDSDASDVASDNDVVADNTVVIEDSHDNIIEMPQEESSNITVGEQIGMIVDYVLSDLLEMIEDLQERVDELEQRQ